MHHVGAIVLALAVMLATGVGAVAWRLAQGPFDSPYLAHWLADAASGDNPATKISIASASIAWNGFTRGVGSPLLIRTTGITAVDAAGHTVMNIPQAEGGLSMWQLLLGRIRPTEILIERPELRLRDDASGRFSLDLGGPAAPGGNGSPGAGEAADYAAENPGNSLLAEMAQPARSDTSQGASPSGPLARLSHMRRLRITDAHVTVIDHRLGLTWRLPEASIDMRRDAGGGVIGQADALLALGSQQSRLTIHANLAPGGGRTAFTAALDDVTPATLALDAPRLRDLAALDAPVKLRASGTLGPDLDLQDGRLEVTVGAGTLRLATQPARLTGLHLVLSGSFPHPVLDELRLGIAANDAAKPTMIQVSGTAAHEAAGWRADLTLALDQVAFTDLGALWPPGKGGRGARPWITQNITDGTAHDGRFQVGLRAPADLSDVDLTAATGVLKADDVTLHWLRPVPPIQHMSAELRVLDPDTLEIEATGGRQTPSAGVDPRARNSAPIDLRHGTMHVTGIMHPHQVALIETDLAGSLVATIGLLKEKRLKLLDKHPFPITDPQGQAQVKLNVRLPLEDKVDIDDIAIKVATRLSGVHLGDIALGRDLDQGQLDLTADNDGLKVAGKAEVAGFATQLGLEMDFRTGPPTQVLERLTASGRADATQLARIGLDAGTVLSGTIAADVAYASRRDGSGDVTVGADLRDAALSALILDWHKPPGAPAQAHVHVLLQHGKLAGVDRLSVEGTGISAEGHADYVNGKPSVLRLDRMVIGASDASGTVRFAARPGEAIRIDMTGRQLDLSSRFSQHDRSAPPAGGTPKRDSGTPFVVDARFARALMSRGQAMTNLSLHAENDGRLFQRARLDGAAGPGAPFRLDVTPERGGRRLAANAADAGQLLRALDIMDGMLGGTLAINARYRDTVPGRPLSGLMTVRDFRLRDAPFMAKLLQAMTLYGLVNLLQGPGLEFSTMEAPFTLSNDVLALGDSRMFNSALGLTARGSIDLNADRADLNGTIVPAYFFNSLLGRVPLVGRLFSPERGSGLFAANYTVRGRLADPSVSINPLSALTPGFLRNVFGMF